MSERVFLFSKCVLHSKLHFVDKLVKCSQLFIVKRFTKIIVNNDKLELLKLFGFFLINLRLL